MYFILEYDSCIVPVRDTPPFIYRLTTASCLTSFLYFCYPLCHTINSRVTCRHPQLFYHSRLPNFRLNPVWRTCFLVHRMVVRRYPSVERHFVILFSLGAVPPLIRIHPWSLWTYFIILKLHLTHVTQREPYICALGSPRTPGIRTRVSLYI